MRVRGLQSLPLRMVRSAALLSSSSLACSATTISVRHQKDMGFTSSRSVQYVSGRLPSISELSKGQQDGSHPNGTLDADALADGDDATATAAAAEPSVVDFTKDVPAEKLDRLFHRSNKGAKVLSQSEHDMFARMIYDKFYKEGSATAMDPAMLYQASLEVQWVEEWMVTEARLRQLSPDAARREVKKALLERVDLHKPLSYIIGSQPFFGCDIHCEEPLLCPRPETEMWTHWLVYEHLGRIRPRGGSSTAESPDEAPQLRILDVCCGTGCIGVALAKHVPSAVVVALDILPQAVTVSQENARRNGIPDTRYKAVQSDMFDCFLEKPASAAAAAEEEASGSGAKDRPLGTIKPEYAGTFDVIVSNPPYVLPNQYIDLPRTITHWESKTALVGDDYRESRQYLYFKELCVHGAALLKPRHERPAPLRNTPNMLIEVGLQAHMVAELMEKSTLWRDVEVHLDYAQQERWVSAISVH